MRESAGVERLPNPGHAAIHHVTRRNDVDTGPRLDRGDLPEQVHGRIVVDFTVANHAAVTVIGVLAQAHVADHEQSGNRTLHDPNRLLDDPLLVVRLRSRRVLRGGNTEQHDAAQLQRLRALGVLHQLVHREPGDARHRIDRAPHAFTVHDEERPDELRRYNVRLLHQTAQRGRAPQPAHPADGELGGAHRASKLAAPSPSSKRATDSPAASGRSGSMSRDAVS